MQLVLHVLLVVALVGARGAGNPDGHPAGSGARALQRGDQIGLPIAGVGGSRLGASSELRARVGLAGGRVCVLARECGVQGSVGSASVRRHWASARRPKGKSVSPALQDAGPRRASGRVRGREELIENAPSLLQTSIL